MSVIKHYIQCECRDANHTIAFVIDSDEAPTLFYVETQLNPYHTVWKRIWLAIKYVFGYNSEYGHWDTAMIAPKDVDRIEALLTEYRKGNSTVVSSS
jgi:hypothetical protein